MSDIDTPGVESLWEKLSPTHLLPGLLFYGTGITLLLASASIQAAVVVDAFREDVRFLTVAAAVLVLIVTHAVVTYLSNGVLRYLEGYNWWGPFGMIGQRLVASKRARFKKERDRLRVLLDNKREGASTTAQPKVEEEIAALTWATTSMPLDHRVLPTRLGNILRGGEDYPSQKYGIPGIQIWPLLWLCLPQHARSAVNTARNDMNKGVERFIWASLFCLWAIPLGLSFWALALVPLILAACLTVLCYRHLLGLAETFALLFRAAFDLYRFDLYAQLRLPPPGSPFEEIVGAADRGSLINDFVVAIPEQRFRYLHKQPTLHSSGEEGAHGT